MRFLIDADLPRSVAGVIRRHAHEAIDVRDVGLRSAKDWQIARYARDEQLCLLTGDRDFGDVLNYPPEQYYGIVVLDLPRNATSNYINSLLDSFLQNEPVVNQLAGMLAIVEAGRVRLRSR